MVVKSNIKEEIMEERFLPIGTVVLLNGGKKRVMIIGFCAMAKGKEGKIFDYCGCIYPEGLMASNQTCMFDHNQIEKVFYKGFVDEEETTFKGKLNNLINQFGSVNNETPK